MQITICCLADEALNFQMYEKIWCGLVRNIKNHVQIIVHPQSNARENISALYPYLYKHQIPAN